MKNEETRLLGVDVKNIISVLAVTPTHNGRLVDCVRDKLPKKNRDRLSDDAVVDNLYAALSAKHNDKLGDYVRDTMLWQNPDFYGYTEDDYVLARFNGEVEKMTLADYIDRLKEE
jgi:hypothetical protein